MSVASPSWQFNTVLSTSLLFTVVSESCIENREKNVPISVMRNVALITLLQLTPEGNYLIFQKGLLLSFNQTVIVLRPVLCVVDSVNERNTIKERMQADWKNISEGYMRNNYKV